MSFLGSTATLIISGGARRSSDPVPIPKKKGLRFSLSAICQRKEQIKKMCLIFLHWSYLCDIVSHMTISTEVAADDVTACR
jgi:hypothetical protein